MPGGGLVQFRFRRPARLGKLRMVPAADAGDELSRRHRLRAPRDGFLKFGNRECSLDASRLIAGIDSGSRVVDVRIEETGNDSPAAKVDGARHPGASAIARPTLAMRPF